MADMDAKLIVMCYQVSQLLYSVENRVAQELVFPLCCVVFHGVIFKFENRYFNWVFKVAMHQMWMQNVSEFVTEYTINELPLSLGRLRKWFCRFGNI